MPAVEQVAGTLPPSFHGCFQNTYVLIDCSEIFLETPSDLHMQLSTSSSYKHHNTATFLIACTPTGCSIIYLSTLCGINLRRRVDLYFWISSLKDKQGISLTRDTLSEIEVGLSTSLHL